MKTLRVDDLTERWFILPSEALAQLRDVRVLEQIVGQILGCKVAVFHDREGLGPLVAFE